MTKKKSSKVRSKAPPSKPAGKGRCRACGGLVDVTTTADEQGLAVYSAPERCPHCERLLLYDHVGDVEETAA